MSPSHIISAPPALFELQANALIAATSASLSLRHVSHSHGQLTGVFDTIPACKTSSGSLLELRVLHTQKSMHRILQNLDDGNPCLRIEAAFHLPIADPASEDKSTRSKKTVPDPPTIPATLVVACIYQP